MSITEFKNRTNHIVKFISKMNRETVPLDLQKVFIKMYAATLNINLTDNMVDNIIIMVDNIIIIE